MTTYTLIVRTADGNTRFEFETRADAETALELARQYGLDARIEQS